MKKAVRLCAIYSGLLLLPYGCASNDSSREFRKLYNYYFPRRGEYVETRYRKWFDQVLYDPKYPYRDDKYKDPFVKALQGDPRGFHAFVNLDIRETEGEFSETWSYQVPLVLFKLGDSRFAELLARENKYTREYVGSILDNRVEFAKHPFPKTRSLYDIRFLHENARVRGDR